MARFRMQGLGFRVSGLAFTVQVQGLRPILGLRALAAYE